MNSPITFIHIGLLRPHEAIKEKKLGVYVRFAQTRVMKLMKVKPILIDRMTKVILDGHHRYSMFRSMGCTYVPCMMVDYLQDDTITVLPRKAEIPVSKEGVIAMGLSGVTYPPKTTKHVMKFELPEFLLDMKKCIVSASLAQIA